MSGFTGVISKNWRIKLEAVIDDYRQRKDKQFFRPNGTQVFCGKQGSGKTIGAVYAVLKLKRRYPKCIIVSNLKITRMKPLSFKTKEELLYLVQHMNKAREYIYFQSIEDVALVLTYVNNQFYGVVYLIDEIHTYFNALGSLNVPMFVFTEISQQRKQRKCIIGTSQLFMRMAKPFREQCDNIIMCSTRFGVLTSLRAYSGMDIDTDMKGKLVGDIIRHGWFWQTRWLRESYDTYQKVVSGAEQYDQTPTISMETQPERKGRMHR